MVIWDDGIELSAVIEKPEGSEVPPLVIQLHGFTGRKDGPHHVAAAEAMREAGVATLRFDLYGHGESGGEFRKHTLYKWISNTMAVIDFAREQGYRELYLAGHSQGGLVAALVAGMETDRIRGLILRAPAFMIPQGAREGVLMGRRFDPDRIPERFSVMKGMELEGNYLRVAQTIHVEEAVERFTGPVLILHGDQDDVVPVEDSIRMARKYQRCELKVIGEETHHFDRHPEKMKELIRNWVAREIGNKGSISGAE